MTEYSYYWDGLVTGDATLAPYSPSRYTTIWKNLFTHDGDQGIINEHGNELEVSGIAGAVIVNTGAALVEGYFYENTAQENVTIPTPVSDPRIDRIVLQKDPITQTVRITRLIGVEAAVPVAPTLTQVAGAIWEIPIAQIYIDTGGVITVTDEREPAKTPLIPITPPAMIEIETITATGIESSFDFTDIPQVFKHLKLFGTWRSTVALGYAEVSFNGDTAVGHYNQQYILNDGGAIYVAGAAAGALLEFYVTREASYLANEASGVHLYMPNYNGTTFYKTIWTTEYCSHPTIGAYIDTVALLWENTNAIDRITFQLNTGVFVAGSQLTLLGLL